jgi:hypothetical protein
VIEEIKFHNRFVKQIKAWINKTLSPKNTKIILRIPHDIDYCLIHKSFYEDEEFISSEDGEDAKVLLKKVRNKAIIIAQKYSEYSGIRVPEIIRNKIIMFKL